MVKPRSAVFFLISLSLLLIACHSTNDGDQTESNQDSRLSSLSSYGELELLLLDVFAPQPGEVVLFLVDVPNGEINDNPAWVARRAMADEWQNAFRNLAGDKGFTIAPMLSYKATGSHNSPLPDKGIQDGRSVDLDQVFSQINILVAMTEYSATAPLTGYTERFLDLRVASMPTVSSSMMDTALAADYRQLAAKCGKLASQLDKAESAQLSFSTGHHLNIDLRFRQAHVDDGRLHAGDTGPRVINLPSGEAFIAPYEGEREGLPSLTNGQLPLPINQGSYLTLTIKENRIGDIDGDPAAVQDTLAFFEVDEMRRNLAELGLGCNDKAVIRGNVLEDEKVLGVHLAAGLSDHIGGTTGVYDFLDPASAVHEDHVYAFGDEIVVTDLTLFYRDGSSESIIQDGRFVFPSID